MTRRRLPTWAVVVAATVAWFVVGFAGSLVDLATGSGPALLAGVTAVATMSFVGGTASGLTAALGARRVPAALAAAAGAVLAALMLSFLVAPAVGFATPSASVALVLERVPLPATLPGLACGLLAALGPTVSRATALVVPIVVAQGLTPALCPDLLVSTGDYRLAQVAATAHLYLTAVLLGVALGCSVTRGWWTFPLWSVPLALVPVVAAVRIGAGMAGDMIRPGASYLADDPLELVRVAQDYTVAVLGSGSAVPWTWFATAVAVGAAVAWWRLRRTAGSRTPDEVAVGGS